MRRKADSDLNVECLMSTGVVVVVAAVGVKGRAGRMCTVYKVVVGIGKAEDGMSARVVRRACKSAARRRADTSGGAVMHASISEVFLRRPDEKPGTLPSGVSFSSSVSTTFASVG